MSQINVATNGSNGSRAAQLLCLGIPIRIKCPKAAKAMPETGAGSLFWQPAAAVTGFVQFCVRILSISSISIHFIHVHSLEMGIFQGPHIRPAYPCLSLQFQAVSSRMLTRMLAVWSWAWQAALAEATRAVMPWPRGTFC